MKKLLTLIATLIVFSPMFSQVVPKDYTPQEHLYVKKIISYDKMKRKDIQSLIKTLEKEMAAKAKELKFEEAAELRDLLLELKSSL